MNQFLYTTQNELDRVIYLYKNGKHSNSKPLQIALHRKLNFYDIKDILQQRMKLKNIRNLRLFTAEGVEIFEEDLQFIKNNATLFASRGEDFDSASSFSEYKKIKIIGEGGFGKVILGEHRATKQKVAIKIVNTALIGNAQDIDMVFREAEMLKSLHHKNIVNILRCYTLPNMQVVFIMEYLEGGELLDFVTQKGRLSEFEAREFFKQIADAIAYCHKEKLIHRDLKLENIMLLNKESNTIKIVDFGIAGVSSNFNIDKINVGSLKYMAPEVLSGKIDKVGPSLDVWALGVILYIMVCGEMPFDGNEPTDVVQSICLGKFSFPDDLVDSLSADFKQLIYNIFIIDPHKRATLKMIQEHSWMNESTLVNKDVIAKKKATIGKNLTKLGKDRTGLKVQYSSSLKREGTNQQSQNIQQAIQSQSQSQSQKMQSLPKIANGEQKLEIQQIKEEEHEDMRQSSFYTNNGNGMKGNNNFNKVSIQQQQQKQQLNDSNQNISKSNEFENQIDVNINQPQPELPQQNSQNLNKFEIKVVKRSNNFLEKQQQQSDGQQTYIKSQYARNQNGGSPKTILNQLITTNKNRSLSPQREISQIKSPEIHKIQLPLINNGNHLNIKSINVNSIKNNSIQANGIQQNRINIPLEKNQVSILNGSKARSHSPIKSMDKYI